MNDSLYMNPLLGTTLVKVHVGQLSTNTKNHHFYLVGLLKKDKNSPQYVIPQKELRNCLDTTLITNKIRLAKEDPARVVVEMRKLSNHIMACIRHAGPTSSLDYYMIFGVELRISASTLTSPKYYQNYPTKVAGKLSMEARTHLDQLNHEYR